MSEGRKTKFPSRSPQYNCTAKSKRGIAAYTPLFSRISAIGGSHPQMMQYQPHRQSPIV